MLLHVKVLGSTSSSDSVSVDVGQEDSVETLKEKLRLKFQLEKDAELKLVFLGKNLQDGTSLSSYKLSNGSKLHLVIKKDPVSAAVTSSIAVAAAPKTAVRAVAAGLDQLLFATLRKYFKSDEDTRKVVLAFKRDFFGKVDSLNLDDLERLTGYFNQTNAIRF